MVHHPGRPREFKYKMRQEVIHHVQDGATVEEAAQIVGISLRTVQRTAKYDDDFHHDLELAKHNSHIDPQKLVERAARTHWRAAAWLLERTQPNKYAKRPPNSCSPETLYDMNDWLIETALEATPPEHRAAVYTRMRTVADKAFDILMPDHHEDRRQLVASLPNRPMPLSTHEWGKSLETIVFPYPEVEPAAQLPASAEEQPGSAASPPALASSAPAAKVPHVHVPPRPVSFRREPQAYDPAEVADPIAFFRAQPEPEWPKYHSDEIAGVRLLDNERSDDESNYLSPEEEERMEANLQYARAVNAMRAEREEREAASAAAAAKSAKTRSSAAVKKASLIDVGPTFRGATARADALIAAAAKRAATLSPAPSTTKTETAAARPSAAGVDHLGPAPQPEPQRASHPPNEGFIAPKMQSATYPPATEPIGGLKPSETQPDRRPCPPTIPMPSRDAAATQSSDCRDALASA